MKRWYAIYCRSRQDARAAQHLSNQQYAVFRPLARVRRLMAGGAVTRVESLFPRYLFVEVEDGVESLAPIASTRGVVGVVRAGDSLPAEVPSALIEKLKHRAGPDGCVDLVHEVRPGEPVAVVAGAFRGYDAIFESRSGTERVVVLLTLLGGDRRIELSADAVTTLR